MNCSEKLENIRIISPEELNLEEAKSKSRDEHYKNSGREYPYTSRDFHKAINKFFKCEDFIYFKSLEDITGIEKWGREENEKIGMYYNVYINIPKRTYTYRTIEGEETETERAYTNTETRFHYYTRSEMANKYFNLENNNDEFKEYILKLCNEDRKKIKTVLVELAYALFLYYYYPIHGHIIWYSQGYGVGRGFPVGMRNIFAKIVNENELSFSQSIVLAILFPEFITNENYSELVPSQDNNFICCDTFIKTNERHWWYNEKKKECDHTLIIKQELIDKIKYIFDDDYIFKLAPMEAYALKSKFDILFKEDWFKKYPNISKQNLLDLVFYTEDEKQLIKYLKLIHDKPIKIQEKLINFIAPISSYVSIKNEYTKDEIYNVINFINTLNFYKDNYIDFNLADSIKDYRKDYRKTYTKEPGSSSKYDEYLDTNKRFSVDEMESTRLHLNSEIATPCKILDKEFNIKIKSGIWMMHTFFVDAFETFFREKESLLTELLNSYDCEKYLDELLGFKDIIIKYGYINSNIPSGRFYSSDELKCLRKSEFEQAKEKISGIKSIIEDEIKLVLKRINNQKNNDHTENNKSFNYSDKEMNDKVFVKTKNKTKN